MYVYIYIYIIYIYIHTIYTRICSIYIYICIQLYTCIIYVYTCIICVCVYDQICRDPGHRDLASKSVSAACCNFLTWPSASCTASVLRPPWLCCSGDAKKKMAWKSGNVNRNHTSCEFSSQFRSAKDLAPSHGVPLPSWLVPPPQRTASAEPGAGYKRQM